MNSRTLALAFSVALLVVAPANAGPNNNNLGAARGGAKSSVQRGGGGGGGARPVGKANNGPGNSRPGNKGHNSVVAGNTVVVGGNGGRGGYNNGYNHGYNNGYYNNNGHWENNDNDFLEFVGKTAAVTAGVSVVAAVIGSTVKDKPSDCQQSMSNGQVYMNCNGTWYQPVMSGGQQQYQVVAPPR